MRVITVGNEKGGVAKTTNSVTMAAGLAARGYRVCLIDADAQGHDSSMLGMERRPGLYDWLVRKAPARSIIEDVPVSNWMMRGEHATPSARLALIPSNDETRSIAMHVNDPFLMLKRVAELSTEFDFIVIDTSPTPSMLHPLLWAATTEFIFCSLAEKLSLQGLVDSVTRSQAFNSFREQHRLPPTRLMGIQFSRVRSNVIEHEANIRDTEAYYPGLVLPVIHERIAWAEAAREGKSIFAYNPDSDAALEALDLIDAVEAGRVLVKA